MRFRQVRVAAVTLFVFVLIFVGTQLADAHGPHIDQWHVLRDAWFATYSGKVGVGTSDPETLLDVKARGVFTDTQQNPVSRSVAHDPLDLSWDTGVEYSNWQGGHYATEAGTFAVDVPPTSTVYGANGVAAYIRSQAPNSDLGGTNAVAGYFQAVSVADNANIFGINSVLVDHDGGTGQRMSNEFDFNVHEDSTDVAGVRLYLNAFTANPNATAFQVAVTPGSAGQWQSAYYSFDGAAWVGVNLGTNTEGNDARSQEIRLNGRDSEGVVRTATIQGYPDGAVVVRSGQDGKAIAMQDYNGGAGANIAYFNSSDIRFYTHLTFNHLTGTGSAYACLNSEGTLYRSAAPCN